MSALKELQNYTFTSKYARYNHDKHRRETWPEAVNRVRGMMLEKYKDKNIDDQINWAYDVMLKKKVLGSQRALQFGGKPVFDHNARSYNCSGTYCDRARVFQEIFYVLLCGSGVGYNVSKKHINKLPKLAKSNKTTVKNYSIPDSIEGWADSIGVLLSNYFETPTEEAFAEYNNGRVSFDYSLIRPKGAYLSSSSGRAPGPEPLKNIHNNIISILDRCLELGLTRLRSIDVHDIICHIADGVLSGGVRRSSCICLFDLNDREMRECKSGNWHIENPQRARANNSIILNRNTITLEDFNEVFTNIRHNGEPGFLFTDDEERVLTNPCVPDYEIIKTKRGSLPIRDINIGDYIWDGKNFVEVLNKQSAGKQDVYMYISECKQGDYKTKTLYCTPDHQIVENGVKVPIKNAKQIDCLEDGLTYDIKYSHLVHKTEVFDLTVNNDTHTFWCNGFNIANCGEVGLYAYNSKNKSGFQFCNLTSINCGKVESEEDLYESCRAAAIIGTLQAGFASFPYLGKVTEEITQKEALLGVSLAGMMEKEDITLNPKVQQKAAQVILKTNEDIANKIGINKAARCTVEKPDGQTGTMLSISSGIHPHHSKRYLRRVQANHTENPFQLFKQYNPKACELSVWSANKTDDVISFPIEVPDGVKTKNQLSALQMLENVRLTQNNWIKYGKRQDLCVQEWLSHAVSNTVVVKDDEWDEVAKYVFKHKKDFAGITFLPQSGDKDYPQAPFCAVYTSREIVKEYGEAALWCSGLIELCLQAFDGDLWKACTSILNDNFNEELLNSTDKHTSKKYKSMAEQVDIWERARKYADKYFNGDVKKLTYCLKDVSNWKTWNDLQQSFTHVPYEDLIEDEDYTKLEEVLSCSGGACSL